MDQKIPPVSITAPDFRSKVSGLRTDRAKASEMEHAIRYHIRKHFDEDPAHYTKLSEKLDEILEALKEQWDQLALALSDLVDEARQGPAGRTRPVSIRRPRRPSTGCSVRSWRPRQPLTGS